jgi:hypothetical protein
MNDAYRTNIITVVLVLYFTMFVQVSLAQIRYNLCFPNVQEEN